MGINPNLIGLTCNHGRQSDSFGPTLILSVLAIGGPGETNRIMELLHNFNVEHLNSNLPGDENDIALVGGPIIDTEGTLT